MYKDNEKTRRIKTSYSSSILDLKSLIDTCLSTQNLKILERLGLFIKYRITKKHILSNEISNTINYLNSKFYEVKTKELKGKLIRLECFIENHKTIDYVKSINDISTKILKHKIYVNQSDLKHTEFEFSNYRLKNNFESFTTRFPIIFSTTHALSNTSSNLFLYDYLIIDESSQVDIASATIALSKVKNVILVGDSKQLPNVVQECKRKDLQLIFNKYRLKKYQNYVNYSVLGWLENECKNLYSCVENNAVVPMVFLNEHYRCNPGIINFCNKKFYNNELIVHSENMDEGSIFIEYTDPNFQRGSVNQRESDIILKRLKKIPPENIGVITPFRKQAEFIKESIKSPQILIDTVHKFQGKEKDIIFLSTVINEHYLNKQGEVDDFVNNPNLLNVAISRARKKLYVIGSKKLFEQPGSILNDLKNYTEYYCGAKNVKATSVYSVLDLMYKEYSSHLKKFKKEIIKISDFESENIIATIIKKICEKREFGPLNFVSFYPLKKLVVIDQIKNLKDKKFASFDATHCDFVIYNSLNKKVRLVVEVDGWQHEEKQQKQRDEKKDRILKQFGINLIRIRTTAINCEETIEKALSLTFDKNL